MKRRFHQEEIKIHHTANALPFASVNKATICRLLGVSRP
jgi:hypothetical protein